MTETELLQYFTATFPDVQIQSVHGNHFCFIGDERKMPFATIVCSDEYDQFSDLDRPGVYRLNLGVGQATFESLLAGSPAEPDFTVLDQWLPHPVYGSMRWISVLNPGEKTWGEAQAAIAESHARAIR